MRGWLEHLHSSTRMGDVLNKRRFFVKRQEMAIVISTIRLAGKPYSSVSDATLTGISATYTPSQRILDVVVVEVCDN